MDAQEQETSLDKGEDRSKRMSKEQDDKRIRQTKTRKNQDHTNKDEQEKQTSMDKEKDPTTRMSQEQDGRGPEKQRRARSRTVKGPDKKDEQGVGRQENQTKKGLISIRTEEDQTIQDEQEEQTKKDKQEDEFVNVIMCKYVN